jgi:hypothetical protein
MSVSKLNMRKKTDGKNPETLGKAGTDPLHLPKTNHSMVSNPLHQSNLKHEMYSIRDFEQIEYKRASLQNVISYL